MKELSQEFRVRLQQEMVRREEVEEEMSKQVGRKLMEKKEKGEVEEKEGRRKRTRKRIMQKKGWVRLDQERVEFRKVGVGGG